MENQGAGPTANAQAIAAAKQQMEENQKRLEEARLAINTAGSNENVRIVLRHVMRMSGFLKKPSVVGPNSEVQVSSTIFNVGYEALYHDLRALMSPETKNLVERSE